MATSVSHDSMQSAGPAGGSLLTAFLFGVGLTGISFLAIQWPPWLQAVITLAAAIVFILLWRVQFRGGLSYADPGIFFILVICLYTAIPLLMFEYYDYTFGRFTDPRLYHIVLDATLIADVWLCANLAMAGFGAAYLAFRKPRMPSLDYVPRGAVGALWIGLALSIGVNIIAFLGRGGGGGGDASYADEYLFFRTMPVYVIQLVNILLVTFQVAAFGLFAYYLRQKKFLIATGLLAACLAFFIVVTDARTMLVLLAGGFFILRDHLDKRLSPVVLGSAAIAGLLLFLFLGFIREGGMAITDAAGRNEFVAIFVTALDIQQLYITGSTLDMNYNLLLGDVFRLVPQQLLTFEKIDPATWYVANFYPHFAESGGGLAFGMVSEAVLSGGGFSALLRGAALGTLISIAINYLTRLGSIWRLIIYTWLFINLYQCFRDTTFTLVGRFAFQFLPGIILVFVIAQLLALRVAGPSPRTTSGDAAPPA